MHAFVYNNFVFILHVDCSPKSKKELNQDDKGTCTVPSQKRAHYGISSDPPLRAQFPTKVYYLIEYAPISHTASDRNHLIWLPSTADAEVSAR
jgi:hypothetical protein